MATKPVNITIGATLASSIGTSVRGAKNQLGQLGSAMSTLSKQQETALRLQKLRSDTEHLGLAFNKAKQRSDALRDALSSQGPPTAAQAQQMQKAAMVADKARNALVRQRDALRELKGSLLDAGIDTRNLTVESVKLGSQLDVLRKRTMALSQAQQAEQAHREKRRQLVGDVMAMTAVGMSLAAPAAIAIKFEDQMAKVGAVSNATKEQLVELTAKAREMGRDTRYSATEAGQGMQYLAMAGFNAQQQIAAIGGVLSVASAAGADLGTTSDIVSNVISGFGLSAAEAQRVGDVLTKTFTSSNTTLESLGETFKYVAPVAHGVGADIELVAAMIGVMGDSGIQGSMAGTALRSMFTRMVAPAKDAQKHMAAMGITVQQMQEIMADPETQNAARYIKEMGINVADKQGNLRNWMDILSELSVKLGNLNEQEKMAAMTAIFGKNALSGSIAVMEAFKKDEAYLDEQVANMRKRGATEKEIQEYRLKTRNKIQDRYNQNMLASQEGFANRVSRAMEDTTGGALRVLRSATEDLAIEIGNILSPSIRSTAEVMSVWANAMTKLVAEHPVLTRVVLGTAAAVLSLGIAWKVLGFAWSVTKAPFLSAATMVEALRSRLALATIIAGGAPAKFGILGQTLRALLPTIFSINAALWANSLLLVGAAIAGAALLIYKYWEPLKSFFGGFFEGIKAGFAGTGAALQPLGTAFQWIGEMFSGAWKWLMGLLQPVSMAKTELEGFASVGASVGEIIGTALGGALKAVTLPLCTVIDGFKWVKNLALGDDKEAENKGNPDVNLGTSHLKAQPVNGKNIAVTHNNSPTINITVPSGTDAQGVAEATRREVQRALQEQRTDNSGLYD